MARPDRAKRTMPAEDPTGRRPPAQPKLPNSYDGAGKTQKVRLATRDPRRQGG
jgi:hypothetical protein